MKCFRSRVSARQCCRRAIYRRPSAAQTEPRVSAFRPAVVSFSSRAAPDLESPSTDRAWALSKGVGDKIKPWLRQDITVHNRFRTLMAARVLHPADLSDRHMCDLIKRCGMLKSLDGMNMVHDILDKLIVEKRRYQREKNLECIIHESFFSTALYGWVNVASSLRVAQNRMRELLDLAVAEAQHDAQQFPIPQIDLPTIQLYNTYLHGLTRAAVLTPQAAVAAEATLYEMSQHHTERGWHTKPNSRSYSLVVAAFALTGHAAAGERALGILHRVHEIHEREKKLYEEEYQREYSLQDPTLNVRQIVTPDAAIYTSVMKAVIPTDAQKATELLQQAIEKNVKLDAGMFIMPIKSMAAVMDKESNGARRYQVAVEAEELLQTMIRAWNDGAFGQVKLKNETHLGFVGSTFLSVAYNSCLDVWSKSFCREAPERCETILDLMLGDETGPHVEPSVVTFNSCLYAWFKAIKSSPDVADRAKQLLDRQWEVSLQRTLCMPDFQSYAIVINAYSRSNDPLRLQKTVQLLKDMLQRIDSGEMKASRNPTAPFTAVLGVVARMDDSSSSSSKNEFETAVDTQNDPYSIAQEVYHSIRTDASRVGTTVDHFAASAYLRCIARHCPQGTVERENAARMAFEDASASGQVSETVIVSLKAAIGDKKINELYPDLLKKTRRPKSWSQNVKG